MPTKRQPHRGSLQYWPRVRAKRAYSRIRTWSPIKIKEAKPMGFAGYKVGMTHVIITDARQHTLTKGQDISIPVTVIECPPLKVYGIRFYKSTAYGSTAFTEVLSEKTEKELTRKISVPKKQGKNINDVKTDGVSEIRLLVHTQPKLTGVGRKKPEVFELGIGGNVQEQLNYAKNVLGKELRVNDFAKDGQLVDSHGITRGLGTQGPMKRFGLSMRSHKSEKAVRNPGNVGPWHGPQSWTIAHAGKMGFHQRMEYNKWIVKVGDNPEDVNPKGGFMHYGVLKNQYLLVKGSVGGRAKRLVMFTVARRVKKNVAKDGPAINYINTKN